METLYHEKRTVARARILGNDGTVVLNRGFFDTGHVLVLTSKAALSEASVGIIALYQKI